MTTDFGLDRIGQISIRALDLERAIAFYRDRLGIPFLFQVPKMAFFQCGGVRLMVALPEEEFDHPSSILYFDVDDIRVAHEALSSRGVEFRSEPFRVHKAEDHELWMAFFRDSEGNTLALSAQHPGAANGGP